MGFETIFWNFTNSYYILGVSFVSNLSILPVSKMFLLQSMKMTSLAYNVRYQILSLKNAKCIDSRVKWWISNISLQGKPMTSSLLPEIVYKWDSFGSSLLVIQLKKISGWSCDSLLIKRYFKSWKCSNSFIVNQFKISMLIKNLIKPSFVWKCKMNFLSIFKLFMYVLHKFKWSK